MLYRTSLFVLLLSSFDVLAGHLRRSTGPIVEDSYIVVLKPTANRDAHIDSVSNSAFIFNGDNSITVKRTYGKALNGYAARLKGLALDAVIADPDVDYVVPDSIASIHYNVSNAIKPALIDAFGRRSTTATNGTDGQGVDVYGIDTGIYLEHNDFGGRARWGATFGNYSDADGNGHGTHTASTAVGAQYGIAKAANIIAVKVLDDDGNGPISDIISGIEWSMNAALASGRLSVVNMSLGAGSTDALDDAVKNAIAAGVHFAVAAGNAGTDADATSPARVAEANTVGAVDANNNFADFSNYGPHLDVSALGVDVTAAWIDGPESTNVLSGTSMSSPKVAGYLAVALAIRGKTTPADLSTLLKNHALPDVQDQPANTTDLLAQKFQ